MRVLPRKTHSYGFIGMFISSVLVGFLAACGALLFRYLIAFFHNLFFLGSIGFGYDTSAHTPLGPWGPLVMLAPLVGGVVVVFLVRRYAPEAEGPGVAEVLDSVYYRKGIIRPRVVPLKALASALCIGSGGSLGREGPIIQIGSAFGSYVAQVLRANLPQRITLIGAGAAAGIAATFNTPIGAILFAVEIVLHKVSVRTLVPVAIATVTATYAGRIFFGSHPSFVIPSAQVPYFELTNPVVLVAYAGLGVLMGLLSVAFIRSAYGLESLSKKLIPHTYLRALAGFLSLGIGIYLFSLFSGRYYIEGVGYSTVQDILLGQMNHSAVLILVLLGAKLLSTALTLSAGGSGGIFSPSLFMGATGGALFGIIVNRLLPGINVSPTAFAVAGMAGLVGGSTGAAVTAVVMIYEMTLDYNVIIPMTLTVAISYLVRALLCEESIYTMKLADRGHFLPRASLFDVSRFRPARLVMTRRVKVIQITATPDVLARLVTDRPETAWYLLEDRGEIAGVLSRDAVRGALLSASAEAEATAPGDAALQATPFRLLGLAPGRYVVAEGDTRLGTIMQSMQRHGADVALIRAADDTSQASSAKAIIGVVSRNEIGSALIDSADLYGE